MHELAQLVHDLDLVRLQVPDEVPAEGVAVERVLALEVLRAVLPTTSTPGFRERAHVLGRTYFVATTTVTPGPTSSRDARVALGDLARRRDAHAGTLAATSSRAAASSASRPSSSPLSFRLRISPRISPIRGDSGSPSAMRSAPPISSRTSRRRSK